MNHKFQPSVIREAFYAGRAELSKSADGDWARRDNAPDLMIACLFCRLLAHLKAIEVLYANDFEIEANTVLRSCLETLFWMGATIKDPSTIDLLVKDHEISLHERIKILLTSHAHHLKAPMLKQLEEVRADIEKPKGNRSNFRSLAETAGIGEFYLIYKALSDASAHPSANSLNRHIIKGPDSDIEELSVLVPNPDWDGVFNLGCNFIAMTKNWLNESYSLPREAWEIELQSAVAANNNLLS